MPLCGTTRPMCLLCLLWRNRGGIVSVQAHSKWVRLSVPFFISQAFTLPVYFLLDKHIAGCPKQFLLGPSSLPGGPLASRSSVTGDAPCSPISPPALLPEIPEPRPCRAGKQARVPAHMGDPGPSVSLYSSIYSSRKISPPPASIRSKEKVSSVRKCRGFRS